MSLSRLAELEVVQVAVYHHQSVRVVVRDRVHKIVHYLGLHLALDFGNPIWRPDQPMIGTSGGVRWVISATACAFMLYGVDRSLIRRAASKQLSKPLNVAKRTGVGLALWPLRQGGRGGQRDDQQGSSTPTFLCRWLSLDRRPPRSSAIKRGNRRSRRTRALGRADVAVDLALWHDRAAVGDGPIGRQVARVPWAASTARSPRSTPGPRGCRPGSSSRRRSSCSWSHTS